MGTPAFAVAPLDALIEANISVVAVVTVADKPAGRGRKLNESAVKQAAVRHGIPVLQPESLKDPLFLAELASFHADLWKFLVLLIKTALTGGGLAAGTACKLFLHQEG